MYIYLNRILTRNDTISGKSFLLRLSSFFFLFEFFMQEARKEFVVRRDSCMKLINTKQQTNKKKQTKKKWKSVIVKCLFESREGRDNIGIWIPSTGFSLVVFLLLHDKQKFLGFRKPDSLTRSKFVMAGGFCRCSECLSSFLPTKSSP